MELSVPPFPLRRLAPAALALAAFGLTGCNTVSSVAPGPSPRIAVVEEEAGSETNIGSLSEVAQRNPTDPSAFNTRGAAYAKAGRYNEAMTDFDRALQL